MHDYHAAGRRNRNCLTARPHSGHDHTLYLDCLDSLPDSDHRSLPCVHGHRIPVFAHNPPCGRTHYNPPYGCTRSLPVGCSPPFCCQNGDSPVCLDSHWRESVTLTFHAQLRLEPPGHTHPETLIASAWVGTKGSSNGGSSGRHPGAGHREKGSSQPLPPHHAPQHLLHRSSPSPDSFDSR